LKCSSPLQRPIPLEGHPLAAPLDPIADEGPEPEGGLEEVFEWDEEPAGDVET